MENRSHCPACFSSNALRCIEEEFTHSEIQKFLQNYYHNRVEHHFLEKGKLIFLRCTECQLLWQQWILNDEGMKQLYGKWIESAGSSKKRKSTLLSLQYARHFARLLRLFPNPSETNILDFGMGWGEWCHMGQSFGFSVHGIELSEERIDNARKRGISASLPTEIPEKMWDFIYIEQVLEHLPHPRETLEKLIQSLKKGGYIHIGVPNGKSLVQKRQITLKDVLQKGPAQPLEHINTFSNASLKKLLANLGCFPVQQQEGIIRVSTMKTMISDGILAIARFLPATIFPYGTSLLFQKREDYLGRE